MTVRAWVTISVLALLALGGAFVVRVFSPIATPALITTSAGERLPGVHEGSCWPQRAGELRCLDSAEAEPAAGPGLPPAGSMRVYADFPVQPDDGSWQITRRDRPEQIDGGQFTNRIRYDLQPGEYLLEVEARYPQDAFIRYSFGFLIEPEA